MPPQDLSWTCTCSPDLFRKKKKISNALDEQNCGIRHKYEIKDLVPKRISFSAIISPSGPLLFFPFLLKILGNMDCNTVYISETRKLANQEHVQLLARTQSSSSSSSRHIPFCFCRPLQIHQLFWISSCRQRARWMASNSGVPLVCMLSRRMSYFHQGDFYGRNELNCVG